MRKSWGAERLGPEVLLEAAERALHGDLEGAARQLCAAACARSGAAEARLELRAGRRRRLLGRAGPRPSPAPRPAPSPPSSRPGVREVREAGAPVQRVALRGGRLVLAAPVLPLAPEQDAPLLRACDALLARAAEAEAERWARHQGRVERGGARQRLEAGERERRKSVHDLRAPLVVVKGYTDMLLRGLAGPLPPAVERYVERMAQAAERQRVLLEELFPRGRGRGGLPLREWLAGLGGPLRRVARLQGAALEVAECPAEAVVEGGEQALARLRRGWLRAVGHTVRPGGLVHLAVHGGEGGFEVETRVETREGRHVARAWAVLAAHARRDGLEVAVVEEPGPVTCARWRVAGLRAG